MADSLNLPDEKRQLLASLGYRIGTFINSGNYGQVFHATRKFEPIAVKVVCLAKIDNFDPAYKTKFLPRELYTLKKLHHPHILTVFDIFSTDNSWLFIFLELADGGDLHDLLKSEGTWLAETRARLIFLQFGDAVRYMHSVYFAHRDIKPANILLTRNRTVAKLTDFGFARSCLDTATGNLMLSSTFCYTRAYSAPEVLNCTPRTPYNPIKSDVWSSGIVLFVLLNNKLPFVVGDSKAQNKQMIKKQENRKYNFKNKTLTAPVREVVGLILTPDPVERPSMMEIFAHPWFTGQKSQ